MFSHYMKFCNATTKLSGFPHKYSFKSFHLTSECQDECYYKILGVRKDATSTEIKNAYYELAKKYHPDSSHRKCSVKFQQISNAYDVLGNENKRKKYDDFYSRGASYSNQQSSQDYYSSYHSFRKDSFGNHQSMSDQQVEELLKNVFNDISHMRGSNNKSIFGSMMSNAFVKAGNHLFKCFIKESSSSKWKFSQTHYEIKIGPNGPIFVKKDKK